MLPGKVYRPEDVLHILLRRFWIIVIPFALIAAGTAVYARKLPDWYRSATLIRILPQQVPTDYVRPIATRPIQDRLQSISTQIMSRTKLEQIIREFNLYPEERKSGLMEDVVQQMRSDIRADVNRSDAFTVSYVGRNPLLVMKVTERLAALFMEASVRDRELLTEETDQFIGTELEGARRRLIDQEKKLEAYRMKYAGQLPTQVEANLQSMQNAMSQVRSVGESINSARSRRLLIEKSLKDLENEVPTDPGAQSGDAVSGATPDSPRTGSTAQMLEGAKRTLAAMRLRYSDAWPDVQRQQRFVDELQRTLDAQQLETPLSADAAVGPTAEQVRQKRLQSLRAELDAVDQQIAGYEAEQKRFSSTAAAYQARVEAVPERESEMVELTRDYSTLTNIYNNLLTKSEESKVTTHLESRQIGERFEILDPARLPERPFSPNRQQINLYGMMAGLGIGLAIVALLEYRDSSFKTDDDVTRVLALPVLAVVPLMQSDLDRTRAGRRRLVIGVGCGSAVAASLAVLVYTFVR
jgi:polysaccharide chain length determinant protein (PEP-CTERM system associated)